MSFIAIHSKKSLFVFASLCAINPACAMDSYRLHKPPRITAEHLHHMREEYLQVCKDSNTPAVPDACDSEILSWALAVTDKERAFIVGQHLAKIGAVNYINSQGTTPLIIAANRQSQSVTQMLIQAKADIFYTAKDSFTALQLAHEQTSKSILRAITRLTKEETESIENWLLVHKKIEKKTEYKISLPKHIRILIAEKICELIVQDVHARIIRAGALKTLEMAREGAQINSISGIYNSKIKLLEQYLDLYFLGRSVVLPQILLPKQIPSATLKCSICKGTTKGNSGPCCSHPVCPECYIYSPQEADAACPFWWCKDQNEN